MHLYFPSVVVGDNGAVLGIIGDESWWEVAGEIDFILLVKKITGHEFADVLCKQFQDDFEDLEFLDPQKSLDQLVVISTCHKDGQLFRFTLEINGPLRNPDGYLRSVARKVHKTIQVACANMR